MKISHLLVSVIVGGLSACATTEPDPEAAMAATAESEEASAGRVAEADPDEVICEYIRMTGTKFRKRVCGTREQWERSRALGDEAAAAVHKSVKAQSAFNN